MGARGKREAFSKRLWKTPLHVCTCSQPFPKRLSRPEFPAFSTIAAASIGHALQHKSDPPKRQENRSFFSSALSSGRCGHPSLGSSCQSQARRSAAARRRHAPDPGRSELSRSLAGSERFFARLGLGRCAAGSERKGVAGWRHRRRHRRWRRVWADAHSAFVASGRRSRS